MGIAADIAIILVAGLLGGLAASWAIAARARAAGVDVVVGTALDAAVGRMGALHLAAALPGLTRACGLATSEMLAEDVGVAPRPEHGLLAVPDTPGLGIAVDVPHAP